MHRSNHKTPQNSSHEPQTLHKPNLTPKHQNNLLAPRDGVLYATITPLSSSNPLRQRTCHSVSIKSHPITSLRWLFHKIHSSANQPCCSPLPQNRHPSFLPFTFAPPRIPGQVKWASMWKVCSFQRLQRDTVHASQLHRLALQHICCYNIFLTTWLLK